MSKKIFISDEDILQSAIAQVQIRSLVKKLLDKKIALTSKDKVKSFDFRIGDFNDDKKATLLFTQKAWVKMNALVNSFKTEVEWHGLVNRLDETTFIVNDILLFPHIVTGASATSNIDYLEWLNCIDDETFQTLRFHGHSHVDMGVNPSAIDNNYRRALLNNLGIPDSDTDLFYVFFITNKRRAINVEIFDLQNNALYSTDEITIDVKLEDCLLSEFIALAKANTASPSKRPPDNLDRAEQIIYEDYNKVFDKTDFYREYSEL